MMLVLVGEKIGKTQYESDSATQVEPKLVKWSWGFNYKHYLTSFQLQSGVWKMDTKKVREALSSAFGYSSGRQN